MTEVRWGCTGEQNLLLSRFDGQLLPPGQIVGKLHKVHDAVAVHVAELHQALQSLPAHVQAELVAHPLHVVRADQPFAVLQSCQKKKKTKKNTVSISLSVDSQNEKKWLWCDFTENIFSGGFKLFFSEDNKAVLFCFF